MSQIIGTVIEIGDFLSPKTQSIVVQEKFTWNLDSNRTYIIPDFQREIRWDEEQIVELINNIGAGAKFLGNIILSETKRETGNQLKDYEIIDGQQRITTLLMILKFIQYKYGEEEIPKISNKMSLDNSVKFFYDSIVSKKIPMENHRGIISVIKTLELISKIG